MVLKELIAEIEIPEGIQVEIQPGKIIAKGPKGELTRELRNKSLVIAKEENKIKITTAQKNTKREKRIMNTFKSHIQNMIGGVKDGVVYKLKICASHFPMNVTANKEEFSVKNFLGEKIPRVFKINQNVNVKVTGQDIVVEGIDVELVGQVAGRIEQLTRITNKDRRIFQDGIYITDKNGKEI